MSGHALVSVVLPVCDGERYLAQAIESVLGQTYRPFELIVVDDGSTDRSAAVAARYRGDDVRVVQQPNGGTGAARNQGVAQARGEFLAHLDADDMWLARKLELQAEALTADSALAGVYGRVEEFVSPELDGIERNGFRPPRGPTSGFCLGAMLVRRTAHERVGEFETSWQVGQDLAWLLRVRELGLRFIEVPGVVLRRRLHLTNKGQRRPDLASQRVRMLKQSLDRRRSGSR